eukprot:TRINITY_DN5874_c0_g1_i1.p1 TRINITY_DN5874_c0_g1~~TRINITY_DN5874_c0_g1_i1.p1  ORF type:complete len:297 (-),score=19.75 TRINITY_DN5874_c0_g1_i1:764-1654(-)
MSTPYESDVDSEPLSRSHVSSGDEFPPPQPPPPPPHPPALPTAYPNPFFSESTATSAVSPQDVQLHVYSHTSASVRPDALADAELEAKALRMLSPEWQRKQKIRKLWCHVACISGLFLGAVLAAVGLIAIIVMLSATPSDPTVTIESVDVRSMKLSLSGPSKPRRPTIDLSNLSDLGGELKDFVNQIGSSVRGSVDDVAARLDAVINVTARIENPNRFDAIVNFLAMDARLFNISAANMSLPAFTLKHNGAMVATVPVHVKQLPLLSASSSKAQRGVISTAIGQKALDFKVRVGVL